MPLQPVTFQKRPPSLVEQAFFGVAANLGTNLLLDKFVRKPAAERAEAFTASERGEREEAATALEDQRHANRVKADKLAEGQRQRNRLAADKAQLAGRTRVVEEGLPPTAFSRTIAEELISSTGLDKRFESFDADPEAGIQLGEDFFINPRTAASSVNMLQNLSDLLESGRTRASARETDRANVLIGLAASAPLLLITDSETGKERMTLPSESAAYIVGTTGVGDILQQYGDDPDTQAIVKEYQQVYSDIGADNFRLAPTFDIAAFNEYLDKLTSGTDPSATKFGTLLRAGKHLEELGLLRDDAGNLIQYPERGGEGTLVALLQGGTVRHRLAGYMLANRVFPTRESFEAYKKVSSPYLFSPVMVETMEAVWNSKGDIQTPGVDGEPTETDRSSRGTTVPSGENLSLTPGSAATTAPLQAPGTIAFVEEHSDLGPFVASRVREFGRSSNPDSLYSLRLQNIVEYFTGTVSEVNDRLVNDKIISRGALQAQTQFGIGPLVNVAALQANFIAALDAARDEDESTRTVAPGQQAQ